MRFDTDNCEVLVPRDSTVAFGAIFLPLPPFRGVRVEKGIDVGEERDNDVCTGIKCQANTLLRDSPPGPPGKTRPKGYSDLLMWNKRWGARHLDGAQQALTPSFSSKVACLINQYIRTGRRLPEKI